LILVLTCPVHHYFTVHHSTVDFTSSSSRAVAHVMRIDAASIEPAYGLLVRIVSRLFLYTRPLYAASGSQRCSIVISRTLLYRRSHSANIRPIAWAGQFASNLEAGGGGVKSRSVQKERRAPTLPPQDPVMRQYE
jgi:hypothetical protein